MSGETCQICGTPGPDRRTLAINTGWDMGEVSGLFKRDPEGERLWRLRMCKGCRAILIELIANWIRNKGRLIDPHLDDDGIAGYSAEEVKQGLAGPELQKALLREEGRA